MMKDHRGKALVVDDDAALRRLVARALSMGGWNVQSLGSGREALDLFRPGIFSVVVMDVAMGWPDGIETARRIRELEPSLPIVLMSGDPLNKARVEDAGLGPMVGKPFDIGALGGTCIAWRQDAI